MENETAYDQQNTENDGILGNYEQFVSLDSKSSIILPIMAEFSDAESKIIYNKEEKDIEETKNLLQKTSSTEVKINPNTKLIEKTYYNDCNHIIQKEKENINDRLITIKQQLAGKRVAISAGHDKAPALIALAQELNLVIVYLGILTYDNTTKEKFIEVNKLIDYDFITLVNPQTYEELPIINELRPDLYIGPAGLTPKVTALNIPAVSTHFNDFIGTFFGFQGVVNFGEYILRSMNDPIPSHMNEEYFFNGNEKICGERWFEKGIASCEK